MVRGRTGCERDANVYESRINHTNRDFARKAEGRRILLPDVQRQTDCTTMSEQKRTCEDKRRGREPTAVHREVQEKS